MEWLDNIFGVGQSSKFGIKDDIEKLGYEGTAEKYREGIKQSFSLADPNGIYKFMLEDLDMPLWDLMNDQMKQAIANNLVKNAPSVSEAYKLFKDIFQIDPKEASKYIDFSYQDIWADTLTPDEPIDVPVEVKPEIIVDMDALKKEIEELIADRQLDYEEIQYLAEKYQSDKALDQALKELNITLDDEGYLTGNDAKRAMRYIASAGGVSDVGWGTPTFVDTNNEPMTEENLANGVATGTERANVAQNEILNSIMRGVESLLRKQWNVNVYPSAAMGFMNGASAVAASAITGEKP